MRRNRGIKDPKAEQVSYRHPLHRHERSGARASRHPPRWRAQSDATQRRDEGGGSGSGSSPIRRFRLPGAPGRTRSRSGQWRAGSEAKSATRWTPRGGCRFPPTSAASSRPATPTSTDGLRPQLVIVYGDPGATYLECFTIEAIDRGRPQDRRPAARLQASGGCCERLFNGQSLPDRDRRRRPHRPAAEAARQDRPRRARRYFIGVGDTFQIWKPETYETR